MDKWGVLKNDLQFSGSFLRYFKCWAAEAFAILKKRRDGHAGERRVCHERGWFWPKEASVGECPRAVPSRSLVRY
jgi:hypothetical protein